VTCLIDNAAKYTSKGGTIGIQAAHQDNGVSVTVTDTGIGIASDKQKLIFDAFSQIAAPAGRISSGTGLGLSISSRLVALMGGELQVQSEPGKGSTFSFSVQFKLQNVPPSAEFNELRGKRVLVVDDNASSRDALSGILAAWGAKATCVDSAHCAEDALAQAVSSGQPFSYVIIDDRLPDTDGFALAEETLRLWPSAAGAIVAVPVGRESSASHCKPIGPIACVAKPITRRELINALRAADETKAAAAERTTGTCPTRPLRVLMAEDNESIQVLARRLLEKRGHALTIVSNGRAAVQEYKRQRYDLVLMDIRMPEMDGLEATRQIRNSERSTGRHVPIVALTAAVLKEEQEQCLETGMDGYISKPFDTQEFIELIESHALAAAEKS